MKNRRFGAYLALLFVLLSLSSARAQEKRMLSKSETKSLADTLSHFDQWIPLPKFLQSNELANEYCSHVLTLRNEQYATDSIAAVEYIVRLKRLIDQFYRVKPKYMESLGLMGFDGMIHMRLNEVQPRCSTLLNYCNKRRQAKREAQLRSMPQGKLLSFCYEEWGSSRPNPVKVAVSANADGEMEVAAYDRYNRYDDEKNAVKKILASEAVLSELRQRIEKNKLYQLLGNYDEPCLFRDVPQLTGGPPSWMFKAVFEDGTVSSGGDHGPVLECQKIGYWLMELVLPEDQRE